MRRVASLPFYPLAASALTVRSRRALGALGLLALSVAYATPGWSQDAPGVAAFDAARAALAEQGVLVLYDTPRVEDGATVLPNLRFFTPVDALQPWQVTLPVARLDASDGAIAVMPIGPFEARLGPGAGGVVFDVTAEGARFAIEGGPDWGMLEVGAPSVEVRLRGAAEPFGLVATANGLSYAVRERADGVWVDRTLAWSDAGLRWATPAPKGDLTVDVEAGLLRADLATRAGGFWETVPWMVAIEKGMEGEWDVEMGRLRVEAATATPDGPAVDTIAWDGLESAAAHTVEGIEGSLRTQGLRYASTPAGGAVEPWNLFDLRVEGRLPTHRADNPQAWVVEAQGRGTRDRAEAPVPFAFVLEGEGDVVMPRSWMIRGALGESIWRPWVSTLDMFEARVWEARVEAGDGAVEASGSLLAEAFPMEGTPEEGSTDVEPGEPAEPVWTGEAEIAATGLQSWGEAVALADPPPALRGVLTVLGGALVGAGVSQDGAVGVVLGPDGPTTTRLDAPGLGSAPSTDTGASAPVEEEAAP